MGGVVRNLALERRKKNNMTQEDKQILLKDLCARLPYGVKFKLGENNFYTIKGIDLIITDEGNWEYAITAKGIEAIEIKYIKPYLRPMSSMTEEERKEYIKTCIAKFRKAGPGYRDNGWWEYYDTITSFDWLNAHHFDYRGLIEKGLAIEVTKENNPYEN